VSWGPQCGNPLYPGVYTRVSSFSDWIKQNVNGN
jgi:secreted trypsin-like serine protease